MYRKALKLDFIAVFSRTSSYYIFRDCRKLEFQKVRQKKNNFFLQRISNFVRVIFIVFTVLLIYSIEGRVLKRQSSIEPQYENCKGKDIYKLDAEFKDTSETEAVGNCIDCFIGAASDTDSL